MGSTVRFGREHMTMVGERASQQSATRRAIMAIAVGGFVAGTIDLLQACIFFGWKVPLVIAGGLLGRQAISGGGMGYLHSGCPAALFYSDFSSGYLLWSQSQTDFFDGELDRLRPVLWHGG